ncbi:MAG: hypothetical protein ACKOPS_08205 [Cyanobium sp.]
MACPHCGEHLLHKSERGLACCGCGRPRLDLPLGSPLLKGVRRPGLLLLAGVLCFPLGLGMAALDGIRSPSVLEPLQAQAEGEQP